LDEEATIQKECEKNIMC